MLRLSVIIIFVTAVFTWTPLSHAALISDSDLWQGATITGDSGDFVQWPVENLFRSDGTLFKDYQAAGYMHWVEWQTSASIYLNSFNLVASHDYGTDPHGDYRDINYRGFSEFRLFTWGGTDWTLQYELSVTPVTDPNNPNALVYGGGTNYTAPHYIEVYENVYDPTTAQLFRAEFVQYGNGSSYYGDSQGPRVLELDGYSTPVPVASTILLLGSGLIGLAGIRRKFGK